MGKNDNQVPTFRGERTGVIVQCEGGSVSLFRGIAQDNEGKEVQRFSGGGNHFENFISALHSGRREDLNADVLEGHISTAVTHTANISYRVGRVATEREQRAQVEDTPVFNEMYSRLLDHLKAHEIDPDTATLGPWLECDRENECFKSHDEANKLVRGFYREPYVVPDLGHPA